MTKERVTLYHYPLCPFSRKVRLCLFEKGVEHVLQFEKPWERRIDFLKLNPAGEVPVLVDVDGTVLSAHQAICEYLNETRLGMDLLGDNPVFRAEVRRLMAWFDTLFYKEVYETLVDEKLLKQVQGKKEPDSVIIRAGRYNLKRHLKYVEWLAERRNYLAGAHISMADFDVAAHVSVLDYLGEIDWNAYPETKAWYARIKSRPSFQSLLMDRLPGMIPPDSYSDLDF